MTTGANHMVYNRDGSMWGKAAYVMEYQQEHVEGPYIASFSIISGENGADDDIIEEWFNIHLMSQFATRSGGEMWRGFVWDMTLEIDGEVRIKSMENMTNAVKTKYTGPTDSPVHTAWITHDESISNYGRKERVVTSTTTSGDEATERANVELQYHADPYTAAIGYKDTDRNRLTVNCVGRMVAGNNIQLLTDTMRDIADEEITDTANPLYGLDTLEYGDDTNVGDEIRRIVAVVNYAGGWLYALDIQDNDTETVAGVASTIGAFDRLRELAQLRNSDEQFYRLTVTNDGGVIYRQFEETVNYLRYPAPRGLEMSDGTKPKWNAKPGIIKYIDSTGGVPLPYTQLSDRRLAFYPRTVMRDEDLEATFHGLERDAVDIYRALEFNQRNIEALNR